MDTISDYDQIPYFDCPIAETHPDHLCIIGRLFGVETTSPDHCRVLELGCASGGNLIPMAYYWPQSDFVGVELSEKQAQQGQQTIRDLGLYNIEIQHTNILNLDESIGKFDYIIAHGVYSWVPIEVQEHILNVCKTLLEPDGIAYISYNTLPGWEMRKAMRDMMFYHSRDATSAEQRLEQSIAFLRMYYNGLPSDGALSEQWLKQQALSMLKAPPSYLYHDYLEANNIPVYFHRFMASAEQFNLQYVAEASLYTMLGSTLTLEAEEVLDQFDDTIEYEQYLDFYYFRHFRQTLLCHNTQRIEREIELDILHECQFFSNLSCEEEIDLHNTNPQSFSAQSGENFTVSHPLTKAAITELATIYPNTYTFSELAQRANHILQKHNSHELAGESNELLAELFNLYLSHGIRLSAVKRTFPLSLSSTPKTSLLTNRWIKLDKNCIASVHHHSIDLNPLSRALLLILNGQLDKQNTIKELLASDEYELISFLEANFGSPINEAQLANYIDNELYYLLSHGLIEPG